MRNFLAAMLMGFVLSACGGGDTAAVNSPRPSPVADGGNSSPPPAGANNGATSTTTSQGNTTSTAGAGTTTVASTTTTTAAGSSAPVSWKITDLGPIDNGVKVAISQNGKVLFGNTSVAKETYVYENGTLTQIQRDGQGTYTEGIGINDAGQILGRSYNLEMDAGGPRYVNMKYFIYSNGQFQDFADAGQFIIWPQGGINNSGQVVGTALSPDMPSTMAVLYSNGTFTRVGSLAQNYGSYGTAINDKGEIAGYAFGASYKEHAFLYSNGNLIDLGRVGDDNDYAHPVAINNAGHVAGYFGRRANGNVEHVFLYKDGQMTDLGRGRAHAMNNLGQIIGYRFSEPGSPSFSDAIMFDGDRVINLNTLPGVADSGWYLANGLAINDRGQIVGRGIRNNQDRIFLLEPVYQ